MLDDESLRKDEKGCGRPMEVYASELVVPENFVFPLFEAQVGKLLLFKPEAEMPKFDVHEALPFEGSAPEPKPRVRRTNVILERAIRFGKTVGCKGCDRIEEGVRHSDACHEKFKKLLEDEAIANREKSKAKAEAARLASEGSAPAAPVHTSKEAERTSEAERPEEQFSGIKGGDLDYWDFDTYCMAWKRVHVKPQKRLYTPVGRHCPFDFHALSSARETEWKCRGKLSSFSDDWQDKSPNRRISSKTLRVG